jgi:hypothetical protein
MSELGFVGFKDYRIERCIYGFVVRRLELYEKVQQPIIERCQQFSYQKNVCGIKRNFQYERRDGPVSLPGRRWREAKMGDFQGVVGQPEILVFAGR